MPRIPALRGLALVALTALSVTWGTAWAQTDQAAPAPADQAQTGNQIEAPAAGQAAQAPAAATPGDEHLVQPDTTMREPERLQYKPSGFWTSGRPSVGGAYRYRLLGIGVAVLVLTAIVMIWVVRRHPERRA